MGSRGQVSFQKIVKMLKECAPGHSMERKVHNFWVRANGRTFRSLPTGKHGAKNPEIEVGHIRHMVRHLGIDEDCAKTHLPQLR